MPGYFQSPRKPAGSLWPCQLLIFLMTCCSLVPPIGPSVLLPLCGSHHGSGCVPWTLHKWGLHSSVLQAAPGETHPAVGSGVSGPRAAQELGVDSVSVTILPQGSWCVCVCIHALGGSRCETKESNKTTIAATNTELQIQMNKTEVIELLN